MFYSLRPDCFFRKYDTIGYIGRPIVHAEEIVNQIGAIFLQYLTYEFQDFEEIVDKILCEFDVDREEIRRDALFFFDKLVQDGFLYSTNQLTLIEKKEQVYSTLQYSLKSKTLQTECTESTAHFLSGYFKDHPLLSSVHFELTSKCNERCIHCFIPHENKCEIIDSHLMISILSQCKELGVLDVGFSGGEPMLHPQFCQFLRQAKDLDFNVTVLSNLTLLNDDIISALAYRHPSCVKASLYSMTPHIHDKITTLQGSQEITKKNIEKLVKIGIPVQINCPVLKQNKNSFEEVIEWGQNLGCTVSSDYLISAREDGTIDNLENRLTKCELAEVINKIINHNAALQSDIKEMDFNQAYDPEELLCGVAVSALCIGSNGDVYPCAGCQRWLCGNANKSTIKEIWEDSPLLKHLRFIRRKDFQQCMECEDKNFCAMCMARNVNEDPNGDMFNIPEITCFAAKTYHRLATSYLSYYKS